MGRPLTAAELRAAAEQARAEADSLELQAAALRTYADGLDAAAEKAPLTIGRKRSMVSSIVEANLEGKPENVRTSANRSRRESKARDAMIEANKTAADLARACKVGRSTANAWLVGTRGISAPHRATLARPPFNIPADAWPRVT